MSLETVAWLQRIRGVEREHLAAQLAAAQLLSRAAHDSSILGSLLKYKDVRVMAARLEGTYIVRLFAEFETGLRLFWPTARNADPPGRTVDLIDGLAATRRIPAQVRTNAHGVREFRNALVHEREIAVDPIPLAEARAHVCRFFSYLPQNWH